MEQAIGKNICKPTMENGRRARRSREAVKEDSVNHKSWKRN
jgi:hypothetical protein